MRGGSWNDSPQLLPSAIRYPLQPDSRYGIAPRPIEQGSGSGPAQPARHTIAHETSAASWAMAPV